MDMKVSRKEPRMQPQGMTEVLVSNVFDIYNKYDTVDPDLITDMEVLDNDRTELLDRAMFASVKQRGSDPLEVLDGIQWSESVMKEVPVQTVQNQIQAGVQKEGPGVQVLFSTLKTADNRSYFQFQLKLTNAT